MKRQATAVWHGTGLEGKGTLNSQSGVLKDTPYSFRTRFQNEDGKEGTNPEELIAAAHAGCFTMALSFQLVGAGFTPTELKTEAAVTMEKVGDANSITNIHLTLTGKVPDITKEKFQEIAEAAKKGCPVSRALGAVDITLSAELA